MKIGVLALQGAFAEHIEHCRRLGVETREVRLPKHLAGLDGLIIPGGESTTIGKLAVAYGLVPAIREMVTAQKPVWGTCAGMILLAKDIGMADQPLLGVMDIVVRRNAFGRQVDSFEIDLPILGLDEVDAGDSPCPETPCTSFHCIFIRAPLIESVGPGVEVLARLPSGEIVAARQKHLMATAFHPELTEDLRFHKYFLRMVSDSLRAARY